ncbi:hypothetical protein NBRC10512_007502 [Rhodotorula toruloides]|uniref:RHTO0S06e00342g1_1 n=2 Tax=Rhodotorula toruloides TaxID=5286 RepID=A0A061AUG7_RHOTO|nr:DUF2431 domain containing protein [Rhodotorula toruloides NP11]EMS24007.1 DUF2431 domain containing protein [Rhodotorula toruloides NP11]CDR41287.1 RHTO0S06e00342g1_1 [Rhodotorula toruloides]
MAKGPKGKGKLAQALAKQQHAASQRQQEARARQAEEDRAKAVKAKMAAGGQGANGTKKRRVSEEGAGIRVGGEAAQGKVEGKEIVQEKRRRVGVQPFRRGERILLVGEGNFSFSHSLLLPHSTSASSSSSLPPPQPLITPSFLLCTSYDSPSTAAEKYPDLETHVSALREAGATVLFGIDATRLEDHKEVREFCGMGAKGKGKEREEEGKVGFDKIVFNFPHVGQGITDQTRNIRANQTLLLDFYRSASLLLRSGTARAPGLSKTNQRAVDTDGIAATGVEDGFDEDEQEELRIILESASATTGEEANPTLPIPPPPSIRGTILLTLRTNAPYSSWLPAQLATKGPLLAPSILPSHTPKSRLADQPTYRTVRSWEFEPDEWEGYEHRRTRGWEEGKSAGANEDLRLSARERLEKKKGAGGAEGREKEGKGQMRTWEFEVVTREDRRREAEKGTRGKGRRGVAGAGGKKRKAGGDPDLSE